MLRINNLSQVHMQRTIQPKLVHTQGTPYPAYLSAVLADGTTPFTKGSGSVPGTGGQGPIFAGMVAAWSGVGEQVCVSVGGTTLAPLGLFANMIGGDFDELQSKSEVGVWYGPGSTYQILSPAFNSNITGADEATGADRLLYADANGKLNNAPVSSGPAVARLIDYISASKIEVMLLV